MRIGKNISQLISEASITLMPKLGKDITRKKIQTNILYEHKCKNPQQNLANRIQQHIKGQCIKTKWFFFFSRNAALAQHLKINVIHYFSD